ncbi:MAG: serine protease [Pirellulales bacterium]
MTAALCFGGGAAGDELPGVGETKLSINVIDPVRVLSADKALEFEADIKKAYAKLAPSVVRLWPQDEHGAAFDGHGLPLRGCYSGVLVDTSGLILTCSHHGMAPGTSVTVELADGKRVAGSLLGRFRRNDPRPMHFGPDLGLARITEPGEWPAATVDDGELSVEGQACLAIGYPSTLRPGSPPLLRVGRVTPSFSGLPWLETTTAIGVGDSGGPLFDLAGRIVGIASGGDSVGPARYQSLSPFKEFRERLESGELVSAAAKKVIRASRARPAQPAAFIPAADLEDQVLQVGNSMIRIMDGPHEIAAGLIVDANGLAVTKASLLGSRREWSCRLFYVVDEAIVKGQVVATSAEHDLALMKVDVQNLPVAPWSANRPAVGTIVSSPLGRSAGPLQFAVVSANECAEPARPNDIPQIPLSVEPGEAGAPIVKKAGWANAEFDAYRELFQPGDVVTHLNGIETPTIKEFGNAMDRLLYAACADGEEVDYNAPAPGSFAGDWVSIGIRRGFEKLTIRIPKIHSGNEGALDWHSNPRSLRREGFPIVFAHDGCLRPEQCGGPVVDLAGRVVGLNIARADTTRTLAIPADVLQTLIAELRQQADEAAN